MSSTTLPDAEILLTPVSHAGQIFAEVGVALAVLILLAVAIRIRQRWKTSMGFVVMLGALVASGVEVVFNTAANFWYFQPDQVSLFSTWGRSLPIWALFSYVPFYAGLGTLGWFLLEQGIARRTFGWYVVGVWLFAMLTEMALLSIHVYQYYGDQPYQIATFPIWISGANAGICTTVAVGAACLSRVTSGSRQWLLVVLGPPLVAAFLIGTTFPGVSVLHADNPSTPALYVAGAASTILAGLVTYVVCGLIPRAGFSNSLIPERQVLTGAAEIRDTVPDVTSTPM